MKKFFILILIILFGNVWLYYQNYFGWQGRVDNLLFKIYHLDAWFLDNKSLALRQARGLVDDELTANRLDLAAGPCLSEELLPNWSLDLVHQPRTIVDDQPENQCQYFLVGRTTQVIEYDLAGNFMGIKSRLNKK